MGDNMDTIRIGTLNTQNSKINRTGGITKDGIDNAEVLAKHIENNSYYFLGTQELTRVFSGKLLNHLNDYKLYGNYRYGSSKIVKSISFLDDFNENNAIITNKDVVKTETKLLPWFPNNPKDLIDSIKHGSIMPRIITMTEVFDNNVGNVIALNTHLDYQLKSVQTRQLKNICKIISILIRQNPNIVLTGDFNMQIKINEHFDEFVQYLNQLGLKRVGVNNKTNAEKFPNQTAIDHIFIPRNWEIMNAGLINDSALDTVTDHKGVYADIKIR